MKKICERSAGTVFKKFKDRQVAKFDELRQKLVNTLATKGERSLRPGWIVNLSSRQLSAEEESVLAKGPKYAIVPTLNSIDFAAPIESALQSSNAPDQEKEIARIKICEAIRRAKNP